MSTIVGSTFIASTTTIGTLSYLTTASVASIQPNVKRFIPMKRHVDVSTANSTIFSQTAYLRNIDQYLLDTPYLYYVENKYNDDDYESCGVTLFRFKIQKETECYYVLISGQRISKALKGRTFALTPAEALAKAMQRADNYKEILIRRLRNVSYFIDKVMGHEDKEGKELREFSKIVEGLKSPDEIPSELFQKFTRNPQMFDELEL
jgi:hypothetical protein